jgi:hypothetical protein
LGSFGDSVGQKETKNKKEALLSRVPQTASGCMYFNRGDHPMWEKLVRESVGKEDGM